MQLIARKAILEFRGFVHGFQQKNFQGELNIAIFFQDFGTTIARCIKIKRLARSRT